MNRIAPCRQCGGDTVVIPGHHVVAKLVCVACGEVTTHCTCPPRGRV